MRVSETADSDFCDRTLDEVSRTFALSIRCLPEPQRSAVRTAYLLCRIVDTVEDDRALEPSVRACAFGAFDAALRAAGEGDFKVAAAFSRYAAGAGIGRGVEHTLCTQATTVFREFSALSSPQRAAIAPCVLEMSLGMAEYACRADTEGGLRLRDLADLERYCHYVAGTVGELLTELFALECSVPAAVRSALSERAGRFGLGLQLVNILKDVTEDAARGDYFLPRSVTLAHGVELERILDPELRAPALGVLRAVAARAREHLQAAEEYTLLWPQAARGRAARSFCAGPLALALGTLRQVELGDDALLVDRAPTVSREFVMNVFSDIASATCTDDQAASDRDLRTLFDRARVGIAGRPSRPPPPPPPTAFGSPSSRRVAVA